MNSMKSYASDFHRGTAASVVAAFGALLLGACSSGASPEPQSSVPEKTVISSQALSGAPLAAFELDRPARTVAGVAQAGAQLLGLLSGATIQPSEIADPSSSGTSPSLDVASTANTGLTLSYRPSNDFFVVTNENVTSAHADLSDIGVDAARSLFMVAMKGANSESIVPSTGLIAANARSSQVVEGEGAVGQQPTQRTAEYVFTVPRTINGVEVFDAGFEVSVHRSGRLARVKKFGPAVISAVDASGIENPGPTGYTFAPAVSADDIASRAQVEYPNAIRQPLVPRPGSSHATRCPSRA